MMKRFFLSISLLIVSFKAQSQGGSYTEWMHQVIQSALGSYPSLEQLTPQEVASIANRFQKQAAQTASYKGILREIRPESIQALLDLSKQDQPKVFIRVGLLQENTKTAGLSNAEKRIQALRAEEWEAPLSLASSIEWIGELLVWKYIKQKTGICVCLQSADYPASLEIAELLAKVLETCAQPSAVWSAFLLPAEEELSTEDVLAIIPDGVFPWEEKKVDALFGSGTFKQVNDEMQEELQRPLCTHTLFIALTYRQQLNAIALLTQGSEEVFDPLGMIFVTSKRVVFFPNGIFGLPVNVESQTIESSTQSLDSAHSKSENENENPERKETAPHGEIPALP